MYKLKNNVEFKMLEKKFNYRDVGDSLCCSFNMFGNMTNILINKDTRKILRVAVYDTRTIPTETEIEHLTKADLVEKI